MIPVARKNLFHNPARLAVALGGVIFGVVLTLVELGILMGFLQNSTKIIDRSPADLWILAPGTQNQDMAHPIPERVAERVGGMPGVAWAEHSIMAWGVWKGEDGKEENVEIVGVELDGHVGIPFDVDPLVAARLREPGTVLLDRAECARLGVHEPGTVIELWGRRAEVVGFTEGGRAFTTAAMLVASYEQSKEYIFTPMKGKTIFVQVKVQPAFDIEAVRESLQERIEGVEVLTSAEFRFRTQWYWLVTTGVGTGFLISALMGLLVGGAIVAQVLYANVMESLKEFAVMKAMGANTQRLLALLMEQALYIGLVGCTIGMTLASLTGRLVAATETPMHLPWQLSAAALGTTVLFCILASLIPARTLLRLEPAAVFMG